MNPSLLTRNPGFGLGLRTPHYADFLAHRQPLDWLEIISDNYMVQGGRPLAVLDRLRADYPMVMHGVAMSLASPDGPDIAYLQQLKSLADRVQPLWVSDHLCWSGWGQTRLHDLNPVPYTDESARRVIAAIGRAQEVLGRRLVLENVSSYVQFADSACSEWQFLSHVAQEADCLLLLDVNNIYVSSVNHGFDPLQYLRALPAHRIQQIHLAGHTRHPDVIIDTHDHPVCEEVWQLYAQTCTLLGPVATMIERDDHIPPLAELLAELNIARELSARHAPQQKTPSDSAFQSGGTGRQPPLSSTSGDCPLSQLQGEWVQSILTEPLEAWAPVLPRLSAGHRFDVYHNAYQARLAEALADTYAKTALYMGSTLFDAHARRFALDAPPRVGNLNDYGHEFVLALTTAYPQNPELAELAALEWHLRDVFDAPNEAVLQRSDLSQDPDMAWLQRMHPMRSHARLLSVTRSVAQIWNAIHREQEVAPVQTLTETTQLLIWRKGEQPHFASLSGVELALVTDMLAGHSIAQACERAQDALATCASDFLSGCLDRWLSLEWLVAQPCCHE